MTSATLIDGKALAAAMLERLTAEVATLKARRGLQPGLAVVLVGENAASQVYVRSKARRTVEVGMHSVAHRLAADCPQDELLQLIAGLNADSTVHGILVQLPLPSHLDAQAVLAAVDPAKDVDGFHPLNAGRLAVGQEALVPCTPQGCLLLLEHELGSLRGAEAVVVGRSSIVGKPMAQLLLAADCTVTVAHSRTRDLAATCRRADVLVVAVGRPELVRGDWIRPGAAVIDVGINRVSVDGRERLVGDVAFAEAREVAGCLTPVPGGVGPMTIACLLGNTLLAAKRQAGLPG